MSNIVIVHALLYSKSMITAVILLQKKTGVST
jgi:hypothetical protein